MIKKPISKKDKKHNQQAFYTYAANKTDIVDRRDADARICFERKPYYMVEKERLRNECVKQNIVNNGTMNITL